MSELIISVSGLRGIIGHSLTADVARRYACSLAGGLPLGKIVITRDGRASGPMLAEALIAGLTDMGRDVINADVAATPTTGVLVRHLKAAGGIQISASHNPAEYNGLKLFSAEGRVIPEQAGAQVAARFRQCRTMPPAESKGKVELCFDSTSEHLSLVLATVDVPRIRERRFSVLLDANHGAGAVLGRKLLEALGCNMVILGESPDGQFEHTPEPTAENLAGVLSAITRQGCDIGFCQDPDADRLAIIDAAGRYLGEEYTLAMCVDHRLRSQRGPIVTNCSTSQMSQRIAEHCGVPFYRSAVGEANVVDCMLVNKAILGGEGNGGAIDPRVGWVRDSFSGMALVLDAMAARDLPVSQLADELPRYEIVKTKAAVAPEKTAAALDALAGRFPEATADRQDGLRLDWPGKWLLVRASNTEPIVRVIAEASTQAEATELCRSAQQVIAAL